MTAPIDPQAAEGVRVCTLNDTADVAEAIGPTLDLFVKQVAPVAQKVADDVYERFLYSVQDYLKENAEWNIGGEIERCRKIEANNRELRASQAELVEALRALCAAAEYWAGCDEGVTPDDAASEIMSAGGAWPSVSYGKARALLRKIEGGDQ